MSVPLGDVIAVVTLVGCSLVVVSMGSWLWQLRQNITPLWYFFASIIFAKLSIGLLSVSWLVQVWWVTLVGRSLILMSVFIQLSVVIVLWRRRHHRRRWFFW